MSNKKSPQPTFTRSEVATVLNISTLTIANREKHKKYPPPKRDLNNYRIYTLNDVLNLQLITFNHIDPKPIISVLYDKGYRDTKYLAQIIDEAISSRVGSNAKR